MRAYRMILAACSLLSALAMSWLALCVDVVAHPRIDPVGPVDAVYVLGPLETRDQDALAVMARGVAPIMLATESINQQTGEPYYTQLCGTQRNRYMIECVVPTPYDTVGEARLLADQVRVHGWKRVAVFTSTPHATRARLLMSQCVSAEVLVWDYERNRTVVEWLGEFVHQSGGMIEALVSPAC